MTPEGLAEVRAKYERALKEKDTHLMSFIAACELLAMGGVPMLLAHIDTLQAKYDALVALVQSVAEQADNVSALDIGDYPVEAWFGVLMTFAGNINNALRAAVEEEARDGE